MNEDALHGGVGNLSKEARQLLRDLEDQLNNQNVINDIGNSAVSQLIQAPDK